MCNQVHRTEERQPLSILQQAVEWEIDELTRGSRAVRSEDEDDLIMKREERSGDALEDVDQAGASLEEVELVLTELKEAIAFGGALDDQLSHEANKLQIKLMKAKGRQISRVSSHGRPLSQAAFLATEIIVARQLARQLRALVPVAQLRLMRLHVEQQHKQRLDELQVEALVCVGGLVPRDGDNRIQVLARLQALGEWAVPGSRMQLFGSTACDLHAHGADRDLTLIPTP